MVEAVLYESENSSFYVLLLYYKKRCPFMLLLTVRLTNNCSQNLDSNSQQHCCNVNLRGNVCV